SIRFGRWCRGGSRSGQLRTILGHYPAQGQQHNDGKDLQAGHRKGTYWRVLGKDCSGRPSHYQCHPGLGGARGSNP
ncbi:hypothetical protein KR067_011845, partial [Drosophila pandora]